MTMAEFNIRLFAFNRMQKEQWIHTREIAYNSLVGGLGGAFHKVKIPTKKQFLDLGIDKDKPKLSEKAIAIFKQQQQVYNNRHNGK